MTAALLLVFVGAAAVALVAWFVVRRATERARALAVARLEAERVAELRAVREELAERERILAHMSDGVALLDGQDRVRHMSHRFVELVGSARVAPPGTPLAEAVRAAGVLELVRECRASGSVTERRITLWSPAERPLRAEATPLSNETPPGVLVVLQDLSEPERLDRMRRDFVANVSHELRTPLTSLRGYAETLLAGGLEDAGNRERFVGVIRDQAVRLQAMTEDLLSLAELERPDAVLHPQAFDLQALAASVAASFRDEAARRGLALAVEPGEAVEVTGDRTRIEQAIANLVDNALKYTERGGVTLRTGRADGRTWCEVADTGPGISAEHRARVFERFYRVDPSRSRERGGTGLGLAIVKHIAELHRGTVRLDAEPGRGSRFRIEWPLSAGD